MHLFVMDTNILFHSRNIKDLHYDYIEFKIIYP